MIKKCVSKHDFISGGPKSNSFRNIDRYLLGGDVINITDNTNYVTNPSIILTNPTGGNIFSVSDMGIYYGNQPLVTEDRLREIVMEMMSDYFA